MIQNKMPPGLGGKLIYLLNNVRGSDPWRADCPLKQHKKRLSVLIWLDENGREICFCWSCGQGSDWRIRQALGLVGQSFAPPVVASTHGAARRLDRIRLRLERNQRRLERTLSESTDIGGTVTERYLRVTRQLDFQRVPMNIRHHSRLPYFDEDGQFVSFFQAMIAEARDIRGSRVSGLCTFLTDDGRKIDKNFPERKARKFLPSVGSGLMGAAVRLAPVKDSIVVGEGIETTWALSQLIGVPGWACLSDRGLERVQLPSSVAHVVIAVDNDEAGWRASERLAQRLLSEGRKVVVAPAAVTPKQNLVRGYDWADRILEDRE